MDLNEAKQLLIQKGFRLINEAENNNDDVPVYDITINDKDVYVVTIKYTYYEYIDPSTLTEPYTTDDGYVIKPDKFSEEDIGIRKKGICKVRCNAREGYFARDKATQYVKDKCKARYCDVVDIEYINTDPSSLTVAKIIKYMKSINRDTHFDYNLSKGDFNKAINSVYMKVYDDGSFDEYPLDRNLCSKGGSREISYFDVSRNKIVYDRFDDFDNGDYNPDGFHIILVLYGKEDYMGTLDHKYGADWNLIHDLFKLIADNADEIKKFN